MASPQAKSRTGRSTLFETAWKRILGRRFFHNGPVFSPAQVQNGAPVRESVLGSGRNSALARSSTKNSIALSSPANEHESTDVTSEERDSDPPVGPMEPISSANPPPPPPPPPPLPEFPLWTPASAPTEEPAPELVNRITNRLLEIEKQHDHLREAREDLMQSRYRLRQDRNRIGEVREQVGSREGTALSLLRQYVHKEAIDLPPDILEAFEQIDVSRDQLGLLETDYVYSEKSYTMQEIRYSEQELGFVERLRTFAAHCAPTPDTESSTSSTNAIKDVAASGPDGWKMINHRSKEREPAPPESSLQLLVQTRSTQSTIQDGEEMSAVQVGLFSNQKVVSGWLFNPVFPTSLQSESSESEDQASALVKKPLLDQANQDWYWVGSFGAQFQTGDIESSLGTVKIRDSAISGVFEDTSNDNHSSLPKVRREDTRDDMALPYIEPEFPRIAFPESTSKDDQPPRKTRNSYPTTYSKRRSKSSTLATETLWTSTKIGHSQLSVGDSISYRRSSLGANDQDALQMGLWTLDSSTNDNIKLVS